MPIKIELFVSLITCEKSEDGLNYVHTYYPEVVCWRGQHIFHTVMAIFISIIFMIISLIVTLTFFEAKGFTNNAGAR